MLFAPPGLCDVRSASNQYYFKNISTTWLEARQYCRERQDDLATVRDLRTGGARWSDRGQHPSCVLGLTQWVWSVSDGDDYREGEPNYWNWADNNEFSGKACGTIGLSGKWFSSSCSSLMHFFCYNGKNQHLAVFSVYGRVLCQTDLNWNFKARSKTTADVVCSIKR